MQAAMNELNERQMDTDRGRLTSPSSSNLAPPRACLSGLVRTETNVQRGGGSTRTRSSTVLLFVGSLVGFEPRAPPVIFVIQFAKTDKKSLGTSYMHSMTIRTGAPTLQKLQLEK